MSAYGYDSILEIKVYNDLGKGELFFGVGFQFQG